MKKFTIPLIEKEFYIYTGKEEWERYSKDTEKADAGIHLGEWPGKDSGRACGGWIWIDNPKDINCIIHELTHLMDDVMILVNTNDREFRAYISAWVIDTVLRWAEKGV